ncbi:UNVERIFIED_ORG: pilus assembly protein CpaB [Arthrobacter globiformis]|nr:pilus assembly protein CpaB [Arthrobacter globiformis]
MVEKAISAGTGIDKAAGAVVRKEVPKLAVAAGAVTNLNQVGQRVAAVDLMPGEQLLTTRMVDADALLGPARVQVPTGMQEITLKLPIERVVGGTLTAGDTVGVFLSVEDSAAKASGTQLTFHKVLVTAAQFSNGSTATSQETTAEQDSTKGALNSKKTASSNGTYLITLARNSADAERIVFTTEFGSVYLSKEPANAVEGTSGVVNTGRLFR